MSLSRFLQLAVWTVIAFVALIIFMVATTPGVGLAPQEPLLRGPTPEQVIEQEIDRRHQERMQPIRDAMRFSEMQEEARKAANPLDGS